MYLELTSSLCLASSIVGIGAAILIKNRNFPAVVNQWRRLLIREVHCVVIHNAPNGNLWNLRGLLVYTPHVIR